MFDSMKVYLENAYNKKKYSIKNMYMIAIGIDYYNQFHPNNQYAIAICKKDSYDHAMYFDILSDSKFYLCGDYNINDGEQCCSNPTPILNFLKLLSKIDSFKGIEERAQLYGYITRKDIIDICNFFNEGALEYAKENQNLQTTTQLQSTIEKSDSSIGKILNKTVYNSEPTIGREEELKQLEMALASQKKSPLLVGPPGTGKTAIVEELVYKIQRNDVPNFLENKTIMELDTSSIVAGTKYVGTLEEKFLKLIQEAKKLDAILFIDEIHTIYGAGASSKNDNDIAEMLKKAIDRENIRVVGTTTEDEYVKYFSKDALKRRFQKVEVKEPTEEVLKSIIWKVLEDYSINNNIQLDELEDNIESIIDVLIKTTRKECRNYKDEVNNPDLVISIIDIAFADAKINNQISITLDNLIYAIRSCTRIYENARERNIISLKHLNPVTKKRALTNDKVVAFETRNKPSD